MHDKKIITAGRELAKADKVLVMLHGRGGTAEDILSLASELEVGGFALLAPQATNNSWYPYSFLSPPAQNEPWLGSALQLLKELTDEVREKGIASDHIYFLGFSQGACLSLEFVARNAKKYGGVAALTGGLIGDKLYEENYKGDLAGTPVFIGAGDHDPHVPLQRVQETSQLLTSLHGAVTEKIYPGRPHTIIRDEIDEVNRLLFGA